MTFCGTAFPMRCGILVLCVNSTWGLSHWSDEAVTTLIGRLAKESGIPGIAVGVALPNGTSYEQGFGTLSHGGSTPVDKDTLFQIGSCTKMFIAMGLAHFVDEKAIGWTTTVASILGADFTTNNTYLTNNVNVGDLLSHRTGYGDHSGDSLWMVGDVGTERDLVLKRLPYLVPTERIGLTFMCKDARSRARVAWLGG
eukprot:527361-Prymnesium_polylepis.2